MRRSRGVAHPLSAAGGYRVRAQRRYNAQPCDEQNCRERAQDAARQIRVRPALVLTGLHAHAHRRIHGMHGVLLMEVPGGNSRPR